MAIDWPALAGTSESFVTALAIVTAGIWTWLVFVRQRLGKPKLTTSIQPHAIRCDLGWLIHVTVNLTNNGSVIARLWSAELRLRQLLPLPEDVLALTQQGSDIVYKGENAVQWPMLAAREWSWKAGECELEPTETDIVAADFFVPTEVSVVELYLYIENAAKKRQSIGWSSTTVYELPESGVAKMAAKKKSEPRHGQRKPEERQQPRQPQREQQQSQPRRPEETKGTDKK